MTIKQITGVVMVVAPFAAIFVGGVYVNGVLPMTLAFIGVVLVMAWIKVGLDFLLGD